MEELLKMTAGEDKTFVDMPVEQAQLFLHRFDTIFKQYILSPPALLGRSSIMLYGMKSRIGGPYTRMFYCGLTGLMSRE